MKWQKKARNSYSNGPSPHHYLRLGKLKCRTIVNRRHVRRNNNQEIICATDVGVNMQVPADSRMLFAIIAKKGHLARVCRSSKQLQSAPTASRPNQICTSRATNQVAVDDDCVSDTSESYELFNLQETRSKPLVVTVKLNNSTAHMELDTGASLSIISEKKFCSLWSTQARPELQSSSVKLHTYTKQAIEVLGSITVKVTYKTQVKDLPLLVVAGEGPSLLGRNWLTELQLDWHELHQMTHTKDLQTILNNHSLIFNKELGKAVGITATLHVSDNAKPFFAGTGRFLML